MGWDRHLPELLRLMCETPAERTQREVQEIAEVLSRQNGKPTEDVWNDALKLYRVRYATVSLVDEQEDEP